MKTFLKDFRVLVTAGLIVMIAAYLRRVEPLWIEIGVTFLLPTAIVILVLEDFYRKRDEDKVREQGVARKANLQYVGGMFLLALVIVAWFWSSQSVTQMEMYKRLALTFFSIVLVSAWFGVVYDRSLKTQAELIQARWRKIRPGIIKLAKKDPVRAEKRLHRYLRYALVGDSLDGDLDLPRPLALCEDKPITYAKLSSWSNDDGRLTDLLVNFGNYIKDLFITKSE